MAKEVFVLGSIVQDLISYVERYPRPGESVRGREFKLWAGGKGSNQAVMAAKLGASVRMAGMVGEDIFGDANIKSIREAGVNVESIAKTSAASTATGCVTVTDDGENCIVVTLGACMEIMPARVRELETHIANAAIVMLQNEIPQETNLEAFKVARKHNVRTFLNPAPGHANLERRLLPLTDIICTNQNEAEFITGLTLNGIDEYKDAARKMLEYGPRVAIITLGAEGALVAERHDNGEVTVEQVRAPKVKAIDTTGAGDCFCGSLAYFLVAHPEMSAAKAAECAVQIAAIAVSRAGVQASYPSVDELRERGIV